MQIRVTCLGASLAMLGLVAFTGCNRRDEETLRKLDEANGKVVACKQEVNERKNEVASLKRQLAQALANPGKINLTDPEIINLIASIRAAFQRKAIALNAIYSLPLWQNRGAQAISRKAKLAQYANALVDRIAHHQRKCVPRGQSNIQNLT